MLLGGHFNTLHNLSYPTFRVCLIYICNRIWLNIYSRPSLVKQKHSIQGIKVMNIISATWFAPSKSIIDFKKFRKIHHFYISLKAFHFPDEATVAEHHFKELGRELNIQEENKSSEARSEPNKPTQIEIEVWSSHEIMIRVP